MGAKFELGARTLNVIAMEDIHIIGASGNSRAKSIITKITNGFDSFHFILSYGTPKGTSIEHSGTTTAAVFT